MKLKSSLVVPFLAASILAPAAESAVTNSAHSSHPLSAMHEGKWHHHKGMYGKELTNIINQYASPELKNKLTKDLETHQNLKKQLHQTPGFQKKEAQRQAFYQAHKQEIDAIRQQVKDGKLTKEQAHQQLEGIFAKDKNPDKNSDKKQGMRTIQKELKTAVQKKDQASIQAALEKLDKQLQSSNQQLQKEIQANQ